MSEWLTEFQAGEAVAEQPPLPEQVDYAAAAGLEQLSRSGVQGLRKRSAARIDKLVEDALPDNASEKLRGALQRYVLKAVQARRVPKPKRLKLMARTGRMGLAYATWRLKVPDFSRKEQRLLRRAFAARDDKLHDEVFQGQDRLYIPLKNAQQDTMTVTRARIEGWLSEQGYTGIDYAKGVCVDDRKNTRKIGRLLRAEEPKLFDAFTKDDSRAKLDNLVMVISRNADDVARMSTNRGWASCMASGGIFWERSLQDVQHGTLIAYAVRDTDPEIKDPLARVLLKPYDRVGDKDNSLYRAANIYGIKIPALRAAAQRFADAAFNADTAGRYELRNGLYNDGDRPHVIMPSLDLEAKEFLTILGYGSRLSETPEGGLVLDGTLDLSNAGLTKLPDLSGVSVKGDVLLTGNKLKDLVGCPHHVGRKLTLAGNPLKSLKGLAAHIGDQLVLGKMNMHDHSNPDDHAPEMTITDPDHGITQLGFRHDGFVHLNQSMSPVFGKIWQDHKDRVEKLRASRATQARM